MQEKIYRFRVLSEQSLGVYKAIDEADGSSVFLVAFAFGTKEEAESQTALGQMASSLDCECFSDESQFFIAARDEATCNRIKREAGTRGFHCGEAVQAQTGSAQPEVIARTATVPPSAEIGPRPHRGRWIALAIAVPVLIGIALIIWYKQQGGVVEEWTPQEASPVLLAPDGTRIDYHDRGAQIELSVTGRGVSALYVDANQDQKLDEGDLRFTVSSDQSARVEKLVQAPATWGSVASSASVRIEPAGSAMRTVWVVSKHDLDPKQGHVDIAIALKSAETGHAVNYPEGTLLHRTYRLDIWPERNSNDPSVHIIVPPQPAPVPVPVPGPTPTNQSPRILLFAGNPTSSAWNAEAVLRWQVEGADAVEIQPAIGRVGAAGQRTVDPRQASHYVLTARNHYGTITRELGFNLPAPPAPQIASFSSDSTSAAPRSTIRLHWNVEGPVSEVRIDPVASGLPSQGTSDVQFNRTTEYTLIAQGPGGSASSKLLVRAEQLNPPAISFEAFPSSITVGQPVTLRWSVAGADQVSIEPGIGRVPPSGSRNTHPAENTRYTLTASGRGGTSSRDVFITAMRAQGATRGQIVWTGEIHGTELISIDRDKADIGQIQGGLPGEPCIVQLAPNKNVSVASTPGPRNNYQRLILRVKGNGPMRVVIEWVIQ